MAQHLLRDLLGTTVVGLSRILSNDPSLGMSYVAKSALVLSLADGRRAELLTGQSATRLALLTETQELFLDYETDPDEQLSLCTLTGEIFDQPPDLPLRIGQVTEIWAAQGREELLVALLVADSAESIPRLNVCTESDEVEVMTHEQMQERLEEIKRSYVSLTYHTYGT